MTALYSSHSETLTSRNIVDAYCSAYSTSNGQAPKECYHLNGRWFIVDGVERERGWMILEIERLRQEALVKAFEQGSGANGTRGRLFKMIRRLSSF